MQEDADYRVRLEGRAELLDATRLRYRALVQALQAFRWKAAVRRNARVLAEVARTQPEVEAALGAVERRAAAEAWREDSQVLRCAREVRALHGALAAQARRRVAPARPQGAPGLEALLEALEAQVVTAPRLVLPGQRWATAVEVLAPETPELEAARRFGQLLEALFSRPSGRGSALPPSSPDGLGTPARSPRGAEPGAGLALDERGTAARGAQPGAGSPGDGPGTNARTPRGAEPGTGLPFSAEEAETLAHEWPRGEAALEALWRRLARVDRAGTLVRSLRRRATRAPTHRPRLGPEVLLHAEFWRALALARLDALVGARLEPLQHAAAERWPLLRWLCGPDGPLEVPGLSSQRAALLRLARALSLLPGRRAAGAADWAGLVALARAADAAAGSPDWERLREQLELLVRVLDAGDPRVPPLYREAPPPRRAAMPKTLAGLAEALRALAG